MERTEVAKKALTNIVNSCYLELAKKARGIQNFVKIMTLYYPNLIA